MKSFEQEMIERDAKAREDALASGYTGLDIVVMGQATAMWYNPETDDEVCISISSGKWGVKEPQLSNRFADILRLEFDDVHFADRDDPTAKQVSRSDVDRVVEFVEKHKDKKRMVVHCFAGLSRSRSMAAAICEHLKLPYTYFVLNSGVYNAMKYGFERKGL